MEAASTVIISRWRGRRHVGARDSTGWEISSMARTKNVLTNINGVATLRSQLARIFHTTALLKSFQPAPRRTRNRELRVAKCIGVTGGSQLAVYKNIVGML